ncbi:efflux RND transporter periplasmic adaptor subunit [Paucibacter sp. R3-3]|uniref:Efflux RND transporter periplasmic adaptor subunit n=1 Tax=Roseateles agri TaxID=3098619 RepID=A0ABU5DMI9_9BURK|nr:efflux RND transporter periplasmic adaptor subunit [Paucibacter sp. R3-3]MDY0747493.1 efflux RND transporter periplasmic adaptor subunit [Paucibacter sp. R3-3]
MTRRHASKFFPSVIAQATLAAAVAVSAGALVGCKKAPPANADAAAQQALLVSPEDVQTMGNSDFATGPVITGSIQPEKRADLRAEVQAVVLQVLKENGERVKKGELLVRLDDTAIRDSLTSADESVRASDQSFDQAERQFQRMKTLQGQGMVSLQAMEDAEIRRNNTQSDLVAAKARAASARQQLQRTEARAPFDGLVSERKVSAGDTAQVGKELVKVIDPATMRFEGLVSADAMAELKLGETVYFKVNGVESGDFQGRVRRIDASANPTTRQVAVLVDFVGEKAPTVAGLYAEGRVQTQSISALMLAEAAIQREGDKAFAWVLGGDGKLAKVALKLGQRDDRLAQYQVLEGLKAGDRILRRPGSSLSDGRHFEMSKPAAASAAPAASAASGG